MVVVQQGRPAVYPEGVSGGVRGVVALVVTEGASLAGGTEHALGGVHIRPIQVLAERVSGLPVDPLLQIRIWIILELPLVAL